jgi:hypothetical protein
VDELAVVLVVAETLDMEVETELGFVELLQLV